MKEIWKDIPNYKGLYQVSNLGYVKSLHRYVRCKGNSERLVNEKILVGFVTNGYKRVLLCKENKKKFFFVHSIVAKTFIGGETNRFRVVDHINNIRTDNRLENLQIISQRENVCKDKFRRTTLSKYAGVSYKKKTDLYVSNIHVNGKNHYLGCFKKELDASDLYLLNKDRVENGLDIIKKIRYKRNL